MNSPVEVWGVQTPVAGQFQLVRHLGQGGMGEVYLARDFQLGRMVALKTLRIGDVSQVDDVTRERALKMMRRDAANTARLNHPNIVQLLHYGVFRRIPFMVLEYVPGKPLSELLFRDGALTVPRALHIARELASALAYSHGQGIIHRDIKPSNLMLIQEVGQPSKLKVLDFGIGLLQRDLGTLSEEFALTPEQVSKHLGDSPAVAGTPAYMAPEQRVGTQQDERVDVWAFGVVLYELLTNLRPYEGTSDQLAADFRPRWPSSEIPTKLRELVEDCLKPQFHARIPDFEEVERRLDELEVALGRERFAPVVAKPVPVPRNTFVGRASEMQLLEDLVTGQRSPLVVVKGTGGMGKSRLALEWAARARDRGESVVWCDITEAVTTEGVLLEVAQSLELKLGADPIEYLGGVLQVRDLVLIIDNGEQVIEPLAAVLSEWVSRPGVRVVLTSRVSTGLASEQLLELAPLKTDSSVGEARELFVARAAEVKPGWTCRPDESDALDALVEQLDGLPLAIELAAARVRILRVPAILERMSQRFTLLRNPSSKSHARQATLASAIKWSWNLLTRVEQYTMRQLAVFEGGFTLEYAEACVELGPDNHLFVMDVLQRLVGASMLVFSEETERFSMLVSIHEFSRARLAASPEEFEARERHALLFGGLGTREKVIFYGDNGFGHLLPDVDNFDSAATWALGQPDDSIQSAGLHALGMVGSLLLTAGTFYSPEAFVERFKDHATTTSFAVGRLLYLHGTMLHYSDRRHDQAWGVLEVARNMFVELDDAFFEVGIHAELRKIRGGDVDWPRVEALRAALHERRHLGRESLVRRSIALRHLEDGTDPAEVIQMLYEAIELANRGEALRPAAAVATRIAELLTQMGRPGEALEYADMALAVFRAQVESRGEALALHRKGDALSRLMEADLADAAFAEALEVAERCGFEVIVAAVHISAGFHELRTRGNEPIARRHFTVACQSAETLEDSARDELQAGLGLCAAERGDLERASEIFAQVCERLAGAKIPRISDLGRALRDLSERVGAPIPEGVLQAPRKTEQPPRS